MAVCRFDRLKSDKCARCREQKSPYDPVGFLPFISVFILLTLCRSRPPWPSGASTFSGVITSLGRPTSRPREASLPQSAWPQFPFATRSRSGGGICPLPGRWAQDWSLVPLPLLLLLGQCISPPPFPGFCPGGSFRPLGLPSLRPLPPPPPPPPPSAGVLLGCLCRLPSPSIRATSSCRVPRYRLSLWAHTPCPRQLSQFFVLAVASFSLFACRHPSTACFVCCARCARGACCEGSPHC